jgi:hypothetical protein
LNLKFYADNLLSARSYRIGGEISTAMEYEKENDRLYKQLPKYAKW